MTTEIVDNSTGKVLLTLTKNDDMTYTMKDEYGMVTKSVSFYTLSNGVGVSARRSDKA